MRHEIIALHSATTLMPAEFSSNCVQLRVSGSGTGVPENKDLVRFPGGYNDNDPGLYDPQASVSDQNFGRYVFPGPPLAIFQVVDSNANYSNST